MEISNTESRGVEADRNGIIQNIINFGTRFNLPLRGYSELLKLVELMPGMDENLISILPKTFQIVIAEKMTKNKITFYIDCLCCKKFVQVSFGDLLMCPKCQTKIELGETSFFVYLSLKNQLVKSVKKNVDSIINFRNSLLTKESNNSITD